MAGLEPTEMALVSLSGEDEYVALVKQAQQAHEETDIAGYKLAQLTFDAITELMDSGLNKEDSLKKWIEDIDREGYGITSARRYYTLWEKHGSPEDRIISEVTGKELSFAEHYAAIKGGSAVKERLQRGQSIRASARTPEMISEEAAAKHAAALESVNVDISDEESDTTDLATRINAAEAAIEYVIAWATVHAGLTPEQADEFVHFTESLHKYEDKLANLVPTEDEDEAS
jgi:hypothetical protein